MKNTNRNQPYRGKRKTGAAYIICETLQHMFATFIVVLCLFGVYMMLAGDAKKAKAQEPEIVEIQEEEPETRLYSTVPLDAMLQTHIINLCDQYSIEPAIVFAVIEQESSYRHDAIGDGGNSIGLMQIQPQWNQDRMEALGVTDLLDPAQNVAVGIDILAELLEIHDGNPEMALISYNTGETGAYEHYFQYGIYSNEYSQNVMANAKEILKGGDAT